MFNVLRTLPAPSNVHELNVLDFVDNFLLELQDFRRIDISRIRERVLNLRRYFRGGGCAQNHILVERNAASVALCVTNTTV